MSKGLERKSVNRSLQLTADYQDTNVFSRNLLPAAFDRGHTDPLSTD
jgi:hypothetical protein